MERERIDVTEKDIAAGDSLSENHCALGLALSRAGHQASVTEQHLSIDHQSYQMGHRLTTWLTRASRLKSLRPITIELKIDQGCCTAEIASR